MVKHINMAGVPHKWLALMNYIHHSTPAVFQLVFADSKVAGRSANHMRTVVERNPTWFPVLIVHRGCFVYVIKETYMQKAVVVDD